MSDARAPIDDERCDPRTSSHARAWWIRAKLRRRLFAWFGITIVVTALFTGGLSRLLSDDERPWRDQGGLSRVVARLFPADAPDETLRETARVLAEALGLSVRVDDAAGARIVDQGACAHTIVSAEVAGARALTVVVCGPPRRVPVRPVVVFVTGLLCLWAMAGLLARRLARPLEDVARVATSIAEGDLSARARVDDRVRGEARALADTVNAMAARIEAQLADQKELLAAVSHELRTPLGHLAILADTLDDLPSDDAARARLAQNLRREVAELDQLVDELLASARLDFRTVARLPVDVTELCRFALERRGMSVDKLRAGASAVVDGDRALLLRAIANLIENAERHGAGLTELVIAEVGAEVEIVAHDRGPGFSRDDEDALFRPFQASASSTTERSGLGLGLSLVRRIAVAHGGRAFARNRTGGGAEVGLALTKAS